MPRDPTPSLILPPRDVPGVRGVLGAMWASGMFAGFRAFVRDEQIAVVINCLRHGEPRVLALEEPEGLMTRLQAAVKDVARAMVEGQNVLVHCQHGIHRKRRAKTIHCYTMCNNGPLAIHGVHIGGPWCH